MNKKVSQLSIFLIKSSISNLDNIIDEDKCDNKLEIKITPDINGKLFIKNTPAVHPKWARRLFSDLVDLNEIGTVQSLAAALLFKTDDGIFVATFGSGSKYLIKDNIIEERFGLIVTLNSVDQDSLRCIDKNSLDSIESHSRIQSAVKANVNRFGLDIEQDLLKAVVGSPLNENMGCRMTGTESLSVSVKMDISDLPNLVKQYKEKFEKGVIDTEYEWINNISIVKDKTLVNELDNKLTELINIRSLNNIWLSIPEIIDWENVVGFMYSHGQKSIFPDINFDGFFKTINKTDNITIDILKKRRVFCANGDHEQTYNNWTIYKCIYAEIDLNNSKYILND